MEIRLLIFFTTLCTSLSFSQVGFVDSFFDKWRRDVELIDTLFDLSFLSHHELSPETDTGFIVDFTYIEGDHIAGFVKNNFEPNEESIDYFYCIGDTTLYFSTNHEKSKFRSFECSLFIGVDWCLTFTYHQGNLARVLSVSELNGQKFVSTHNISKNENCIKSIDELNKFMIDYYSLSGIRNTRDPKSYPEYWFMYHSMYLKWENIFEYTEESMDE